MRTNETRSAKFERREAERSEFGTNLAPNDVGVGELVDVGGEEVVREGRDLLDSAEDDVVDTSILTLLKESLVDLSCRQKGKIKEGIAVSLRSRESRRKKAERRTRADDDPLDLLVGSDLSGDLRDEPLESSLSNHVGEIRSSVGVSKEVLGEEDDELRKGKKREGQFRRLRERIRLSQSGDQLTGFLKSR